MTEPIWTEGPEDADWIKTMRWDLPTDFRQLVLFISPKPILRQQKADLSKLMALPAWDAAPRQIRNRAAAFLAGDQPVV